MATYYVDQIVGSDANVGTSEGAPWKHAPGMADATGTPAATTVGNGDTVYIRGEYRTATSGSNTVAYSINARYSSGASIKPWPGHDTFLVDAGGGHDGAISVVKRVTIEGAIATGSKVNDAESTGFWLFSGGAGSTLRRCVAYGNKRYGFYGNNAGAAAGFVFEDCDAYDNTSLPTDASGAGRSSAGFHMDSTGAVRFVRCRAWRNGNSSNVGGDADGRGFSIIGSDNCSIEFCQAWENGDYTGDISSTRNGSGIEGFNADNVRVIGSIMYGQGAAMEVKSSCDNWVVSGNILRGDSYVVQWGEFEGVGSTGLKFYNNLVALERALQFGVAVGLSSGNADLRNNIFTTVRSDFPAVSIRNVSSDIDLSTITLDYNVHYGCGTNHVYYQNTSLNQAYALAAYQALTGASAHSVNSLDNTDPLLDASYRPRAGSPCLEAGTRVADVVLKDFYGKDINKTPDIGAVQVYPARAASASRSVITRSVATRTASGRRAAYC